MYVTLDNAKKHLNIDNAWTGDDNYIIELIRVAEDAVSKNTGVALNEQVIGGELPPSLVHSILLLVGQLYANREATSFSTITEVPYGYKYLVNLNRNFSVV